MRIPFYLLIVVCVAMLSGCGTTGKSALLGHHTDFTDAADGSGARVYAVRGMTPKDLQSFKQMMVDPVIIWYNPNSEYQGIHPDEFKAIADYFRQSAVTALQDRYSPVDRPAPSMMRLRLAISGIERSTPSNVLTLTEEGVAITGTVAGMGTQQKSMEEILQGDSYIKAAIIEAELLDAYNHQRMFAYWNRVAVNDPKASPNGMKWGQFKTLLDDWAKRFRQWLEQAAPPE